MVIVFAGFFSLSGTVCNESLDAKKVLDGVISTTPIPIIATSSSSGADNGATVLNNSTSSPQYSNFQMP